MKAIAANKLTRREAARRLGISERHVNRLMRAKDVRRPRGEARERREEARAAAEERRSMRLDNAARAAAGRQSLAEAAVNAGCSQRTIYRWVARLRNTRKRPRKSSKASKNKKN
jgi:transposase